MTDTVALAQACLDGEDISRGVGFTTADLIEDMMHEIVSLRRDNANLNHHIKHHRDAGKDLHTGYCELRALVMTMQRMANDAVGDLDPVIEREYEPGPKQPENDIAF